MNASVFMPGVDLVISALFETSGLRREDVCVTASFAARASTKETIHEKMKYFTALILLRSMECKAAKGWRNPKTACSYERRLRGCLSKRGGVPSPLIAHSTSSSSCTNCCFKWRRAAFLIARRSDATASFSAWRSIRVRLSTDSAKCEILGRFQPIRCSFGFA